MATIARKWACYTVKSTRTVVPRTLIGASDLQYRKNEIPHCKPSLAFSCHAPWNSDFHSSSSTCIKRSASFCRHELKRSFSTTPKPFSRKKNVKPTGEAETDKSEFEPSLSFNYRATIAIMEIARAVSPVISMNTGYTLTSNFDLRIDGTSPTHRPGA